MLVAASRGFFLCAPTGPDKLPEKLWQKKDSESRSSTAYVFIQIYEAQFSQIKYLQNA